MRESKVESRLSDPSALQHWSMAFNATDKVTLSSLSLKARITERALVRRRRFSAFHSLCISFDLATSAALVATSKHFPKMRIVAVA